MSKLCVSSDTDTSYVRHACLIREMCLAYLWDMSDLFVFSNTAKLCEIRLLYLWDMPNLCVSSNTNTSFFFCNVDKSHGIYAFVCHSACHSV